MHAMCDRNPRARHPQAFGPGARGEWAAWLPLLFIGAMMFWTVALGLGGWSLMVVSDTAMTPPPSIAGPAPTATETMPGAEVGGMGGGGSERIPVQMEESQEPEDVNDNAGSVGPAMPAAWGADEPPGVAGTPR